MTKVEDILARAARGCSVSPPSSWLTATDQTVMELKDFLDQTADDIRDRLEVVGPMSKSMEISGDGSESHDLPDDFHRLHRGEFSVYERQRTRRACVPVSDDGQWEYMKELGTAGAYRFYRLRGYPGSWEIGFQRPLESGVTVVVDYVSTKWIINGASEKDDFTDADDQSLFPRRLMETGIVWRFRRRKALEYEDVKQEYEMLLARYGNDSRTRRAISFGETPVRGPLDIPVPDFIPSS